MIRFPPRITLALLPALVITPNSVRAQFADSSSAVFTASETGAVRTERVMNRTFERVTLDGGPTELLLAVEHELWADADSTERRGTVRVRVLEWDGAAFSRAKWSVEAAADQVGTEHPGYLRLMRYGCCELDNTHTLYDLRDGREALRFTEAPLSTYDTAGALVLVAYESPASWRAVQQSDPEAQGMLRLFMGGRVADEVLLTGGGEGEAGYIIPRGVFCGEQGAVDLNGPDGVGRRAFHACYQFQGGAWAVLPVSGGRFVLDQARLPPGVVARRGGW
jgi:hypothetical protein